MQLFCEEEEMKQIDDYISDHFKKIFLILTGTFLILYLMLTGKDNIWMDEAFSFALVRHSFSEIWRITAADVHPPLYYWYLKVLTAPFHYSMRAAQIASVLPYLFILVFGGMQFRKYFSDRTAVLFMVMFFCYPFALSYSVEVRMYALASACVFACAVFAYRFWREQGCWKDMAGLIISGVLSAYSHYFAFVSICIIYGLLLIAIAAGRKRLCKKWLFVVIASIILYLPWLSSFVNQLVYKVNNEYWIADITVKTLFDYWKTLFGAGGISTYAWFFSVSYLVCIVWVLIRGDKADVLLSTCCLLIPVGTLAVGVLASVLVRPVFIIRYLVPSIPLLVAFMAIVLGKVSSDILLSGILTIVLVGGISNYGTTLQTKYLCQNYLPIEEYSGVDAYIVVGNTHLSCVLGYYVTDENIYSDRLIVPNPFPNVVPLDTFEPGSANKAIMLLNVDEQPFAEYYDAYDVEYLGMWKSETLSEAYLLTKKP